MAKNPEQNFSGDSGADVIDMEQGPETGEWEAKNTEQKLLEPPGPVDAEKMKKAGEAKENQPPEQNLPNPPGKVDKGAVEKETAERDKRRAEESESVLDEELKKGETMDAAAQETRIGKSEENKDKQAAEIREEITEELRKNPVRLTKQEALDISKEALEKQVDDILDKLSGKGKDMYPDRSTVIEVREKMLQGMVDNRVVPEAEKQFFCSREAFYELLKNGYNAEGIRLAGWREIVKEAFWGMPIVQQINFFRNMGEGELLVLPSIGGKKELISLEDFKKMIRILDSDFKLEVYGAQRQAKLAALAEKEDAEIQKRIIEKLEKEEQLAGHAEKREAEARAKIEAAGKLSDKEKLGLIDILEDDWKGANKRHRKIKAIEKALEAGEYKCKTEGGKKLKGEEAKQEMERFKNELVQKNKELSSKIIGIANQLTGRDLQADARQATGYVSYKKTPDKQREFQDWLTKETQNIFKEQVDKIEESSGMRIKTMRWLEKLMAGLPDMRTREKSDVEQREAIDAEEPSPAEKPLIKKGKKLKPVIKNRRQKKINKKR